MKEILLLCVGLMLGGFARASEAQNAAIIVQAQEEITKLAALSSNEKSEEVEKLIRSANVSGVQRHAASSETLLRIFKNTNAENIEYGKAFYYPERNIVIIRVVKPFTLDFELFYDAQKQEKPKLQAVYP